MIGGPIIAVALASLAVLGILFGDRLAVALGGWWGRRSARRSARRGVHALPHRPAPDAPPNPRRHRAVHAHTASFSAADLLAAQRAQQTEAMPRATRAQRRDAARSTS